MVKTDTIINDEEYEFTSEFTIIAKNVPID
jgi:hypothetical protein